MTSEKRLYEETRFAEELQLGFEILHNREFLFWLIIHGLLCHFCSVFSVFLIVFFRYEYFIYLDSVLFCPYGTTFSIKLTTLDLSIFYFAKRLIMFIRSSKAFPPGCVLFSCVGCQGHVMVWTSCHKFVAFNSSRCSAEEFKAAVLLCVSVWFCIRPLCLLVAMFPHRKCSCEP